MRMAGSRVENSFLSFRWPSSLSRVIRSACVLLSTRFSDVGPVHESPTFNCIRMRYVCTLTISLTRSGNAHCVGVLLQPSEEEAGEAMSRAPPLSVWPQVQMDCTVWKSFGVTCFTDRPPSASSPRPIKSYMLPR